MKIQSLKTFVVGNPPPTWGGRYFIFVKLVTDTGIEGIGEVYAASFGPKAIVRLHRGRVRTPRARRRPVQHRDAVAQHLRPRLLACGRTSRWSACSPASRWRCGTSSARRWSKPVHALLGGKVHERLRSYTYLYPSEAEGDAYAKAAVYDDPDVAAERAAEYVAHGFYRAEIRSGRPVFHLRSTAAQPGTARNFGKDVPPHPRGRRHQSGPAVRHARPVHHLRRDPPRAPAGAVRPAVVRGTGAAGKTGGNGDRRPRRRRSRSPPASA